MQQILNKQQLKYNEKQCFLRCPRQEVISRAKFILVVGYSPDDKDYAEDTVKIRYREMTTVYSQFYFLAQVHYTQTMPDTSTTTIFSYEGHLASLYTHDLTSAFVRHSK